MSEVPMEMNSNSGKTKIKIRKARGTGRDARRIKDRLNGFQISTSEAYITITQCFSKNITMSDLLIIAKILAQTFKIHLDRDAKRDKRVLFKWFQEKWEIIRYEIHNIQPLDENFRVVDCFAEN